MPAQKRPVPIGKRLQKLRRQKKMTLKQVANETGLAPDYISKVEKGEVMPPVSALLQFSRAFEIDSSLLLREEKEEADRQARDDFRKRTEDYSYLTLTPEAGHKHLKAFKVFVEPKSEHKGVSYQHQGEEFIYVFKGKIEVMVGESRNLLGPDDSLHFNSSIVHKIRNLSEEQAELLVVLYTP